jgi:hypothetical protein
MSNLVLVRLEMVLASVQDRCTVCAKRTIWPEIVLDAPDATPMQRGPSGFGPFGDSANLYAR